MPRDIPIGNNSLLIAYDKLGVLRDLYFPNVGSENHAQGRPFRLGVWVGGLFSWTDEPEWERSLGYEEDTLIARISLKNTKAGIELSIRDAVDFHENIYVRDNQHSLVYTVLDRDGGAQGRFDKSRGYARLGGRQGTAVRHSP